MVFGPAGDGDEARARRRDRPCARRVRAAQRRVRPDPGRAVGAAQHHRRPALRRGQLHRRRRRGGLPPPVGRRRREQRALGGRGRAVGRRRGARRAGDRARRRQRRPGAPQLAAGPGPAGLADRARSWRPSARTRRCGRSSAALGGDYARQRTDCRLVGRGAHGDLSSVYFGDGDQMLDLRTFQEHRAPDTTSQPAVQGRGRRPLALGLHRPHPHQARGAGHQRRPDQPQPEAVRATPGRSRCRTWRSRTTTCTARTPRRSGPVDEDQRFYLESRGVPTVGRRPPDRRRLLRRGARRPARAAAGRAGPAPAGRPARPPDGRCPTPRT